MDEASPHLLPIQALSASRTQWCREGKTGESYPEGLLKILPEGCDTYDEVGE